MALSNWDCLAFNNEAKACNGTFEHFMHKNSISIYKNWVYVRSELMWNSSSSFQNPTIAQIGSGSIELAGFDIEAVRGPQDGIFIYASCTDYREDKIKRYHFAGIGCSGYINTIEEVLKKAGREPKDDEMWYEGSNHLGQYFIGCFNTNEQIVYWDTKTQGPYNHDSDWIGVLPSTVEEFFKWLTSLAQDYEEDFKEWIEKCKKADLLRFNQGDMFFANNAGVELSATKPGESHAPIFNEVLKNLDEGKQQ